MPKVIKKKVKKNIENDIDVQDRLSELKTKVEERKKTIVTYGLSGLAVILAASGFYIYTSFSAQKARQIEYEAYKTYYNEYQKKTVSDQERFQKALDLFRQAYGSKKSPRVLLYIANSQYELGMYDDALASLNDFIKIYQGEKDMLPLVYQKMAAVHLKKGKKDEALKTFDTLLKSSGDIYGDYALIESARILESEGKKEEASAKYKELTDKFKESPFFDEAKAKLGDKKTE
ncbi:MAG: tetratricopeptide repeat protein [Nitrospirae bacterium]|nr:tetratricopeptide repeat protein [Nitrospirota bacterium]